MTALREAPLHVRSADRIVAHDHLIKTFVDHDLQVSSGALDFRLDVAPSRSFVMSQLQFGVEIEFDAAPMECAYQINIPLAGSSDLRHRRTQRTVDAGDAGVVMHPNSPVSYRWDAQSVQYAMKFPRDTLEAQATRLTGLSQVDNIDFDLSFDLTTPAGQSLVATARFLFSELTRPGGVAEIPSARQELESAFLTQLLFVAPSQLSPRLNRRDDNSRKSRIRDVMAYIDDNPDAELDLAELSAIAGLGARALQAGFQEVAGVTPTAYVRGVRLDRVRADLIGGLGTVTDVAARWGFFHVGHFSRHYRARFGVSPSQTLRGGR